MQIWKNYRKKIVLFIYCFFTFGIGFSAVVIPDIPWSERLGLFTIQFVMLSIVIFIGYKICNKIFLGSFK